MSTFESVVKWIFFNDDDILIFFNPHFKNLQARFARLTALHHLLAWNHWLFVRRVRCVETFQSVKPLNIFFTLFFSVAFYVLKQDDRTSADSPSEDHDWIYIFEWTVPLREY